ncbi:MAG: hypothetical protein V4585_02230 [Bacteroidota bacterium]
MVPKIVTLFCINNAENGKSKKAKTRRVFDDDFKAEIVKMLNSGKNVPELSILKYKCACPTLFDALHILDWFHITMRLTVLNQYVLGILKVDEKIGSNLQKLMASIKWNLWHGKVGEALWKTEKIEDYLEEHKEDKVSKDRYEKLKAFGTYADDFHTYISNNRSFIVNYSDRYLHGKTITTSFIESTVNYAYI